jgi:predicted nucleic acid-binding protein
VTYVDSSALIPIYVPERFSPAARAVAREAGQLPFTSLHRLEIGNAFELMVGRGLITRPECLAVLRQLEDDIRSHRLAPREVDLERALADAGELSRRYTARFLARSLDLLHVACARLSGCDAFVSADDRQLAVARAAGLSATDIKRPRRSRRRQAR